MSRPLVSWQRAYHNVNPAPNQLRGEVGVPKWCDLRKKLGNYLEAELRMCHLASTEFQRHLHLHVFTQEIHCVTNLYSQIVWVNLRAQLNLFDLRRVLVFPRLFLPLRLFVAELAIVDQATNRRSRVGRNLHQVNRVGARHIERIPKGQHPEHLAVSPDDPDFTGTDFPIYPEKRSGRRRRTGRKRATQDTLTG
jgi:hypothetical protein